MTDQQNVSGGVGYQVNKPQAPVILGNDNEININYSPRPNLRAPFQAPPLPRHYVERPEHFGAVKTMLLDESTPGTLVISAIYGMGGIGKSVLAAALVQNGEIQQRFPDGVLWVTLGQQPDMLSMVNLWIRELGDYDYNPTTLQAASLHLRTLLADKQALLVVDDVWHSEHVQPFHIVGAGCCVLITTRRADIADETGAAVHCLDVMSPIQALNVFESRLERLLNRDEYEEAQKLADLLGFLPIALELAASRIARGKKWVELRTAMEAEVARLEALETPRRRYKDETRLEACFNLSLNTLKDESLDLWESFISLGVIPEDAIIAAPMAATLWDVNIDEASDRLEFLFDESLLLVGNNVAIQEQAWVGYRLHDLLHDMACRLLITFHHLENGSMVGAHKILIEKYKIKAQKNPWHTLPDDGYIHRHLAWHFEQAQQPELLHRLLKESTSEGQNGWYEACESLGQTANFVTDVARAWQAAETLYEKNPIESITLQCRYALITTTLNSLAQNIPPELTAVFVQKGVWKPAQGLAYIKQNRRQSQRANGLTKLLPLLPKALWNEALVTVLSIQDEAAQIEPLIKLAQDLPELVSEALAVAESIQDEATQAQAQSRLLVQHLPEQQMEKALTIACSIQDEFDRAYALSELFQYLPMALLNKALALVDSIQDEFSRAYALGCLAQYLPEPQIKEALVIANSIQNDFEKSYALSKLAQCLPEVVSEALATARSIQDKFYKAYALSRLAQHMPEVEKEAVTIACSIQDEADRAYALSRLAQDLPKTLVSEALSMACSIQDEFDRAYVLSELTQYLPESKTGKALTIAYSIQDEFYQAYALSKLAQHQPEIVGKALEMVRSIQDEVEQAKTFSKLAQYLPKVVGKALEMARLIQDESDRTEALSELAPYLPESQVNEAVRVACSIQNEFYQAYVLNKLAQYLPGIAGRALKIVRSIQNESDRIQSLIQLAQYLPKSKMSEAIKIVCSTQDESDRVRGLGGLAPYLSESEISEALLVIRSIQDESEQTQALIQLIRYLPESEMSVALAVACSIQNESSRTHALGMFAWHLPTLVSKALAVVYSIQDESTRAYVLQRLAQYLPESQMSEALAVVCSIQDEFAWAHALSGFTWYLPEEVSEAWAAARSTQDESVRAELLKKITQHLAKSKMSEALAVANLIQDQSSQAYAVITLAQHVPEVVDEALAIARSIQDEVELAKTLRKLVEYLPKSKMSHVLTMVRSIQNEHARTSALFGLASYMPENLMGEALEILSSIQDESARADILIQIAKYLPKSQMSKAVEIICSIQNKSSQAYTLCRFALCLSELVSAWCLPEIMSKALVTMHAIYSESERFFVLESFAPYLPKSQMSQALTIISSFQDETYQVAALRSFAPYLPKSQMSEALTVVSSIQNEVSRAEALIVLAQYLPKSKMNQAVEVVQSIQDESDRADILSELLLKFEKFETVFVLWQGILHTLSYRDRKSFLADIPNLAPAIISLSGGDTKSLELVFEAMRDVCRQWP